MTAPRIAIYARYSSDLQKPSSLADQISLCKRLIKQQFGIERPVAVFEDAELTGKNMFRPGITALLAAMEDRKCNIVVAEGLDRISRSLADIAKFYEAAKYHNVRIYTGHEGEVSELHVGFKGTMNALYLTDLRDKVARAQSALAEQGRIPTGLAYGYSIIRGVLDARGHYVNGLREIDPDQAAVVRRIFEEAASGVPVRAIVRSLNEEGVHSPSGGIWRTAAISGEGARGKGIIPNEIYRGWLVFNRTRKVVDPLTGRRRYIVRPVHEHIRSHVPELAIVDEETWRRAQVRQKIRKGHSGRKKMPPKTHPHRHPLTGLVKCGWCGAAKSVGHENRYICDMSRFTRKCKNARGTREEVIAARLFEELRQTISAEPDWAKVIMTGLEKASAERQRLLAEAQTLEARVERLLTAIERGIERAGTRIIELEHRIREIRAMPDVPEVVSSEDVKNRLCQAIDAIEAAMPDRKFSQPILAALSLIVVSIVLTPIPDSRAGESIDIRLHSGGWPEFYLRIHASWPKVENLLVIESSK